MLKLQCREGKKGLKRGSKMKLIETINVKETVVRLFVNPMGRRIVTVSDKSSGRVVSTLIFNTNEEAKVAIARMV